MDRIDHRDLQTWLPFVSCALRYVDGSEAYLTDSFVQASAPELVMTYAALAEQQ